VKRRGVLAQTAARLCAFGLWKTLQASGSGRSSASRRQTGCGQCTSRRRTTVRRSDGPDGGLLDRDTLRR